MFQIYSFVHRELANNGHVLSKQKQLIELWKG